MRQIYKETFHRELEYEDTYWSKKKNQFETVQSNGWFPISPV